MSPWKGGIPGFGFGFELQIRNPKSSNPKSLNVPKIRTSLGIIPARFASSRFPGKPLVDILGKTMIQRVYEQASQASQLDAIVVATDDERIFSHVQSFGGNVVMTSPTHLSGTDRCAEVTQQVEYSRFEIIANIQGDEPFLQPAQVDLAVNFLVSQPSGVSISTLLKKIENPADLFNPNVVKAVFDKAGNALYFSRQPVPFLREVAPENWLSQGEFFKHIGLYVFRREALLEISKLPPSRLELAESLEQLRWLENGYKIGVAVTEMETFGIDTPEDLAKADRSKMAV